VSGQLYMGESGPACIVLSVAELGATDLPTTCLKDHMVLVGFGRVGSRVGEELQREEQPFLVIEDHTPWRRSRAGSAGVSYGDTLRLRQALHRRRGGVAWRGDCQTSRGASQSSQLDFLSKATRPDLQYLDRRDFITHKLAAHRSPQGACRGLGSPSREAASSFAAPSDVKFAVDSLLEEAEFELPVPLAKRRSLRRNGKCRRGEKGSLKSSSILQETEGSNPLPSGSNPGSPVNSAARGRRGQRSASTRDNRAEKIAGSSVL
jgi:hypothetical protein